MKTNRKIVLSIIIILALCLFVLFALRQSKTTSLIPNEVSELVNNYMEAYRKGTEYAVEYTHFEDEFVREAYIISGDKLLDYKIENVEKINDNLYAFTILVKTEQSTFYSGDIFERVFNFVARIDDEWYFLNGVSHIPADLQENLDIEKYTNTGENIVERDDIVDIINFE
ncbi:hypothetical protein [Flavonifractor plautii]|uniref:hypothetical protein n=1 Tax=Flavonifractor plautii TaxID=292800 RepID=UPI00195DB02C|nr:hypothetical protein [Flavonifractor plautii]MBM6788754.1 hypothetical protein [Flavonifractor plautii]MCI7151548.1 hypothetical protein [Flavonifractor plautii]MCR1921052.1 hypothetical protein [Flavonifractor plautii]MDU3014481.1 hypothetical protein [Flavonifractor plautii]MDY3700203.1 hypothetical protein [Flavonifractor plautii]